VRKVLLVFASTSILAAFSAHSAQSKIHFRCSNGVAFTLSSEGNIDEALRNDGMYVTLTFKGKEFTMISATGADNSRFYGTDNDYSIIMWESTNLLKGKKSIGKRCK